MGNASACMERMGTSSSCPSRDSARSTEHLCERYSALIELLEYDQPEPRPTLAHFWPLPRGQALLQQAEKKTR